MNIKEAKQEISNAMRAYFTKDDFGNYVIPIEKQRPIFLIGAPGIGKTAIMEQVAEELDVALVSYSMTHHTRQSALGLPFISHKVYGGKEYEVSEYTMSEIIASVYDMMEATGKKEGILFLDEINCVSETLAPAMLQFLQYKVFGRHTVPDGWIVVTAGNPPEYNNSVREFDIVTWDRLKRIDVEADYDVWKEYAYKKGVHPAITTYLDIKKGDFYKIETTVDGKSFVTARGWSDLSDMIRLYEKHGIAVKESLVGQYLQNRKIAKDFAIYYDLFNKYRSDYQVDKILAGTAGADILARARKAKFDERLSLLGLLLDAVTGQMRSVCLAEDGMRHVMNGLKNARLAMQQKPGYDATDEVGRQIALLKEELSRGQKGSSLSDDAKHALQAAIRTLDKMLEKLKKERLDDDTAAFALLKKDFDAAVQAMKQDATATGKALTNAFQFCEEAFADGQEMLVFVTELTISYYGARFISRYGCEEYYKHNKELLFYERQKAIITEIESLELE